MVTLGVGFVVVVVLGYLFEVEPLVPAALLLFVVNTFYLIL